MGYEANKDRPIYIYKLCVVWSLNPLYWDFFSYSNLSYKTMHEVLMFI